MQTQTAAQVVQHASSLSMEFELPLSKKKVKLISPTWGERRKNLKESKVLDLDAEETTENLLSKITYVDGKLVSDPRNFANWEMHDYLFLVDKFEQGGYSDSSKNA